MTRSADRLKALADKTRKQFDLDDVPKPTELKGKSLANKARETFKKLRPKTQDELDLETMRGLQDQFPPKISEIPSEPKAKKRAAAPTTEKPVSKTPSKQAEMRGNLWSMPSGAKGYVPELKKTEKQKPAKKEESGKSKPRNKKIKKSSPGYDMFGGTSATGHRPAR